MISKSEIIELAKLNLKKFRQLENKFIAEGKRLVKEGLKSSYSCEKIIVSEDFTLKESNFLKSLEKYSVKVFKVSNNGFNKIASTKNPQGIAAVFNIPQKRTVEEKQKTIVCLENISDPGNVGTILRTCDWFGIKKVILSKDCTEIYNPKVLRASMGAVFTLQINEEKDFIARLAGIKDQGYKLYYADMQGEDYRNVDTTENKVVIFCNEAFGPSDELKEVCDKSITIPKKGNVESLNVAAAAAVILSSLSD